MSVVTVWLDGARRRLASFVGPADEKPTSTRGLVAGVSQYTDTTNKITHTWNGNTWEIDEVHIKIADATDEISTSRTRLDTVEASLISIQARLDALERRP